MRLKHIIMSVALSWTMLGATAALASEPADVRDFIYSAYSRYCVLTSGNFSAALDLAKSDGWVVQPIRPEMMTGVTGDRKRIEYKSVHLRKLSLGFAPETEVDLRLYTGRWSAGVVHSEGCELTVTAGIKVGDAVTILRSQLQPAGFTIGHSGWSKSDGAESLPNGKTLLTTESGSILTDKNDVMLTYHKQQTETAN